MEIEELFCKRYPEYSVNGKPLHPYFDVFEEGYEQAEKEYEQQIEKMKNCYNCAGYMTKQCVGCEDYCNWQLRR